MLALCLAVATPWAARGGVILGQFTWDSGTQGWTSMHDWANLGNPEGGDGWLSITFDPTVLPESSQDEWSAVAKVQASDLFSGTWDDRMSIEFDFFSEDTPPTALQVMWKSTESEDLWAAVVTPSASTGQWTTHGVSFADWTDWMFPGASEEQYLADLSTIDWIGVYIYRNGADEQTYGLDDFKLMIPEPSQFVLAGSAVAACLAALRRRRKGAAPASPAV